jgi:uncharacterized protein (TIGR00299 family) protein
MLNNILQGVDMATIYFDLLSGASGDMLLASMIDLGVPVDYLNDIFARLPIEHSTVSIEKVERSGIQCTHLKPHLGHSHEYRHVHQIIDIIKKGNLPQTVFEKCCQILDALATAEAEVHGIPKEKVHFHEIGAVDTIIDIVGVCSALEYLKVDRIEFSTFTDGHGCVSTAHGSMPVPVPATSKLIQGFGLKIIDIETELLTPTGAAILVTLGNQVPKINGIIKKVGFSCGTKMFEKHPNILRSFIIENEASHFNDEVMLIESDMDHISGEIMGHVANRLMEKGALDVSWTSVIMKKGRPGYRISVICKEELFQAITDIIIIETRTLGVRVQRVQRIIADRKHTSIKFLDEEFIEKKCEYKGYSFSKLEYDALAALAHKKSMPLIELMEKFISIQK